MSQICTFNPSDFYRTHIRPIGLFDFRDIYIDSERLEEVVLECTVVGVPRPSVYWTHNGRLITGDDPRFTPVQGPGQDDHCLIIRHPEAWAAGE